MIITAKSGRLKNPRYLYLTTPSFLKEVWGGFSQFKIPLNPTLQRGNGLSCLLFAPDAPDAFAFACFGYALPAQKNYHWTGTARRKPRSLLRPPGMRL